VPESAIVRAGALRIYPSDGSVMKTIGTLLAEQSEKWHDDRLYLDMREYMSLVSSDTAEGLHQKAAD
jgi:hypothetical protein